MRKVEVTIEIKSSRAKLIAAFTEFEMLRAWWKVERAIIEKRVGGLYTLAWGIGEQGFGFISSGVVKAYDPDSLIVIDKLVYLNPARPFLGPMSLTVGASDKGDSTELYLCQEGYQEGADWDWYYSTVKSAWPVVAKDLKDYLEKSTGLSIRQG